MLGTHYQKGYEDYLSGVSLYNDYYKMLDGNELGQRFYEEGRAEAAEYMLKNSTEAKECNKDV